MDATTELLVDYAAGVRYEDLPAGTVRECKRRLIDTFACMAGAFSEPQVQIARAMAERQTGTPSASVFGTGMRSTPEMAAFANGVMLRYLDMSDMYRVKSGGHPSDVIAAVLAVADAVEADGRAVIEAVTLAYEIYCSFCESVEIKAKGWDQPVFGVIASAIGAGKILRLDRTRMAETIALALAPNMALAQTRRGELSMWKNCAGANAARNGVFAAALAQQGFTGPEAVFEGAAGLWKIIGRFDWRIHGGAGAPFAIGRTHLKCFPACYHGQTAIWAALDLRQRLKSDSDVRDIDLETYAIALDGMANDASRWAPGTRSTADHSLPYVAAVALHDGEVTSDSFADARLSDPALLGLMRKTKVKESADLTALYPEAAPCRMRITTMSGQVLSTEVTYPKGHNRNPLGDDEIDLKFRTMFRGLGDAQACDRILETLWDFERVTNVRNMLATFAQPAAATAASRRGR